MQLTNNQAYLAYGLGGLMCIGSYLSRTVLAISFTFMALLSVGLTLGGE